MFFMSHDKKNFGGKKNTNLGFTLVPRRANT